MTHDEIAQLDDDGLRLEVARAKGWVVCKMRKNSSIAYPVLERELEDPVYYAEPSDRIVWGSFPDWPRDIAAAWELVEEAQAKPHECYFEISHTPAIPHKGKPCWHVELGGVRGYGDTAPLAICRAWLMWKQA